MPNEEILPSLSATVDPPEIRGAALFGELIARGVSIARMIEDIAGPFADERAMLAASFDTAVLSFLSNRRALGLALQADVLAQCRLFRVAGGPGMARSRSAPLRLLAFLAPGDLQMNMPVEFITHHLNVRLDLLFVLPDEALPEILPDHDLAICLISDEAPETLSRLVPLLSRWRRPVLNNPGRVAGGRIESLSRDGIARLFAGSDGIDAPATALRTRGEIMAFLTRGAGIEALLPRGDWPLLLRPEGSHAGRLLERLDDADALAVYLDNVSAERFFLSRFVDYRSSDGLYRKYRVAMIAGRPLLCHMAVSDHWMIHYLNAGMIECTVKRADEAYAMAEFESGFAERHHDAFATLQERLGFDYVLIDCAEAPDGSLLLFEVEMAAIIHLLDPVDLFAYKQPQMLRVFAAFDALLQRSAQLVIA